MTSPAAGAWQKPWPEKPVAYRKRPTDRLSPISALTSGVISYSPAQPWLSGTSASDGAQRAAARRSAGSHSSL